MNSIYSANTAHDVFAMAYYVFDNSEKPARPLAFAAAIAGLRLMIAPTFVGERSCVSVCARDFMLLPESQSVDVKQLFRSDVAVTVAWSLYPSSS